MPPLGRRQPTEYGLVQMEKLTIVAAILISGLIGGCKTATHLHHPLDPPCTEGHYYVQYENCRCAEPPEIEENTQ